MLKSTKAYQTAIASVPEARRTAIIDVMVKYRDDDEKARDYANSLLQVASDHADLAITGQVLRDLLPWSVSKKSAQFTKQKAKSSKSWTDQAEMIVDIDKSIEKHTVTLQSKDKAEFNQAKADKSFKSSIKRYLEGSITKGGISATAAKQRAEKLSNEAVADYLAA